LPRYRNRLASKIRIYALFMEAKVLSPMALFALMA